MPSTTAVAPLTLLQGNLTTRAQLVGDTGVQGSTRAAPRGLRNGIPGVAAGDFTALVNVVGMRAAEVGPCTDTLERGATAALLPLGTTTTEEVDTMTAWATRSEADTGQNSDGSGALRSVVLC